MHTQTVSSLAERSSRKYSAGSTAVDNILGGGFQRGSVLELSGPPGAVSEALAVNLVREFVTDGEGVIFAGRFEGPFFDPCVHPKIFCRYAQFDHGSAITGRTTANW